jgi:N-ethylmaleimide reductase
VAFGVPFISNPDLPARLKADVPLAPANPQTYYGQSAVGYTDYPTMDAA